MDRTSQTTLTPAVAAETPEMFRPPINRAMRVLDRSFFRRTVPLSAATIPDVSQIAKTKRILQRSGDLLELPRLMAVRFAPEERQHWAERKEGDRNRKCLLLRDGIQSNDESTWSPTLQELVAAKTVAVDPYELELDYDYWGYHDIISSVLPEDDLGEAPTGFTQVGHVAHLNLREQYLPYKNLIADILRDKNHSVTTVINKIDDVGSKSVFRTFSYEVLSGDGDMNVTANEQDCIFKFDYSKVYWNTRLNTEHARLVEKFREGEAVCDVMAGVGPFAIPAGKKRIFVYANDLNPHGYESMVRAIEQNKVQPFVRPFNMDGAGFIRHAAKSLATPPQPSASVKPKVTRQDAKKQLKQRRQAQDPSGPLPPEAAVGSKPVKIHCPPTFDHFVMNLPATAISFLDAFIGVYAGKESLFYPYTSRKLPMVHVYCFSTNSDDQKNEHVDICNRISERINFKITPEDGVGGTGNPERELEIYNVRLVSPTKQMFCASFRLPEEVAFKEGA